jgi:hypothetical protein
MAWTQYPPSAVCTRLAALCFGLTAVGCIVNWFNDGAIGIAAIVVLAVCGVLLTAAAHRLSKRGA